jgi:hypothetical protein
MCQQCAVLKERIDRFRRALNHRFDPVTTERLKEGLAGLERQKAALHPGEDARDVDPLFVRCLLAIQENNLLREEWRRLIREQENAIYELRWAIHESECIRAESKARRITRTRGPFVRNLRP